MFDLAPKKVDATNNTTVATTNSVFRDDFAGSALSSNWSVTNSDANNVYSVSGGLLTVNCSATANNSTTFLLNKKFTMPSRLHVTMKLSARDANRSIFIDMVAADGTGCIASWIFDGSTDGVYKAQVGNNNILSSAISASSWSTTNQNNILEIEATPDEFYFIRRDTGSSSSPSHVLFANTNLPDPNKQYQLRIRVLHGSTAPAVATLTVDSVLITDHNEISAEIVGGRGLTSGGRGIPVSAANVLTTVSTPTYYSGGWPYQFSLISAATTNATLVKSSAGNLGFLHVTNTSANVRYLKLYNKTAVPVVGTDTPIFTFVIPANFSGTIGIPDAGLRMFTAGISYAITGAYAASDTTAIGAGEIVINGAYA